MLRLPHYNLMLPSYWPIISTLATTTLIKLKTSTEDEYHYVSYRVQYLQSSPQRVSAVCPAYQLILASPIGRVLAQTEGS
jgi:hypothetical protein